MRRITLAVLVAASTSLLIGSSAQAATVTIGSPLTATFGGQFFSAPSGTWANTVLAEPGAVPASPASGTIVRWRLAGNYSGGPFRLRVLRPGYGGYTGSGTSAPVTPLGGGTQTFSTNLPIQTGDVVGLDITSGTAVGVAGVTGSHPVNWNPALADGSTSPPTYSTIYPNLELGFNADVEYTPSSPATKKCKKPKKHRSAAAAKKKKCKKKKQKK